MTASTQHVSPEAGFTLVEVLVGITILAVLMTFLTSGVFAVGRSTRAGEARIDEISAERLVRAFIRRQLENAYPLTVGGGREDRVFFEGDAARIRFVGHLAAHRGGGGLQVMELAVDRASRSLALSYRDAWADPGVAWEKRALLTDIASIRLRYFGPPEDDASARWQDRWPRSNRLPELIELTVESADGTPWPPLVAATASQTAEGQPQLVAEPAGESR